MTTTTTVPSPREHAVSHNRQGVCWMLTRSKMEGLILGRGDRYTCLQTGPVAPRKSLAKLAISEGAAQTRMEVSMQDHSNHNTPEDSIDQLQADMMRDAPDAVREACHAKAEEFLAACVRYARLMQTADDPWHGIRCLTETIVYIKETQNRMEKELSVGRKPHSTVHMFTE